MDNSLKMTNLLHWLRWMIRAMLCTLHTDFFTPILTPFLHHFGVLLYVACMAFRETESRKKPGVKPFYGGLGRFMEI